MIICGIVCFVVGAIFGMMMTAILTANHSEWDE